MAWPADKVTTYIATLLMRQPLGSIEVAQQFRASFHNVISRNVAKRGLDVRGDYALLRELVGQPISVRGRLEAGDVIQARPSTAAQGMIYPKQMMGSVGWTVEMFEDSTSDRQVYDLAMGRWDRHINGMQAVLNAIDLGDGTGRLARVSDYSGGLVTVDNSEFDFGWDLLDRLENGMLVDIYTIADIVGTANVTCKASEVEVSGVNKAAGTFTITATTGITISQIVASPADNDFVFLAHSFTSDSQHADGYENGKITAPGCWNLPMGVHGLFADGSASTNEFDDGSSFSNGSYYGKTFEGLDRTLAVNSMMRSAVIRPATWKGGGATNNAVYPATLEVLDSMYDDLYAATARPDPETTLEVVSPPTYRWIVRQARLEQNGMQDVTAGHIMAGMGLRGHRVTCGDKEVVVPVKQNVHMPNGVVWAMDLGRLGIWSIMELQAMARDPGGKLQFAVPGSRNLTIEQWSRTRYNMYSPRVDTSARVCGIDISQ